MRPKKEILNALSIVTRAAVGSVDSGKPNEAAIASAMALGWVLRWSHGTGVDEFQEMLDMYAALDLTRSARTPRDDE